MDRTKLLKPILCLMFFILFGYVVGIKLHWDYITWWWDMIMHFSGGLWQGLFFVWFFSIKDLPFLKPSLDLYDKKLGYKLIFYVLLIGLLWEIFEFYANNYIGSYPFDIIDTSSDLFFDLFGGTCATIYLWKKQLK